jgi:hypothetical protein
MNQKRLLNLSNVSNEWVTGHTGDISEFQDVNLRYRREWWKLSSFSVFFVTDPISISLLTQYAIETGRIIWIWVIEDGDVQGYGIPHAD